MFTEDPNKIFTAYRIIGTKWTIHILCTLSQGPKKFGEIFESIPSISEMILSRRLKGLQHDNLVKRTILTRPSANIQNAFLRAGDDEGGSSGLSYTLIVDEQQAEEDIVLLMVLRLTMKKVEC
ncbi:winged helix-turn-helix transcriptional regulator [Paenibacillus sp. Leaf72]|uniref:winged helix-turn-helix transcriptional regulator n=1 Tax=Paenibacillus sp. Leaf72 TaxID=1736234 RepID=UPI0006F9A443|nr:winged helix-turn-helix transcriptional regulator [Paenibacillus sp. Leaf72]KQO04668.1 hypothetical protein ASF12_14165 [Paenibacillus sp. Leaf72]